MYEYLHSFFAYTITPILPNTCLKVWMTKLQPPFLLFSIFWNICAISVPRYLMIQNDRVDDTYTTTVLSLYIYILSSTDQFARRQRSSELKKGSIGCHREYHHPFLRLLSKFKTKWFPFLPTFKFHPTMIHQHNFRLRSVIPYRRLSPYSSFWHWHVGRWWYWSPSYRGTFSLCWRSYPNTRSIMPYLAARNSGDNSRLLHSGLFYFKRASQGRLSIWKLGLSSFALDYTW